ncbi:MAG: hypothetical protein M0Z70_06955 [Nitrospiraceae bacterium]|nr:hypothetical protein [Nitrospiraceae bacterium]
MDGTYYRIALYLVGVLLSFVLLMFSDDLRSKRPYLFNSPTKRLLWLVSCFLLIPFIIFLFQFPGSLWRQIKRFIFEKE